MRSIRTRLTLAFAGALVATMLVLAVSLYAVRRASVMHELETRLHAQADFTVKLVALARDLTPTQLDITPDSLFEESTVARLLPQVMIVGDSSGEGERPNKGGLLELLPNYVVVKDRRGYTLYRSQTVDTMAVDQKGRIASRWISERDRPISFSS